MSALPGPSAARRVAFRGHGRLCRRRLRMCSGLLLGHSGGCVQAGSGMERLRDELIHYEGCSDHNSEQRLARDKLGECGLTHGRTAELKRVPPLPFDPSLLRPAAFANTPTGRAEKATWCALRPLSPSLGNAFSGLSPDKRSRRLTVYHTHVVRGALGTDHGLISRRGDPPEAHSSHVYQWPCSVVVSLERIALCLVRAATCTAAWQQTVSSLGIGRSSRWFVGLDCLGMVVQKHRVLRRWSASRGGGRERPSLDNGRRPVVAPAAVAGDCQCVDGIHLISLSDQTTTSLHCGKGTWQR